MIGQTIQQYLILEKAGGPENSAVYKAKDTKLDRVVLLKAVDVPGGDADAEAAFIKESRAGLSLSHPNISAILDIVEAGGTRYLIYEYLPGGTLRERIDRAKKSGEPIPIDRCIDYVLGAALGLAEAHRHGIVHRDISPDSIIVTPTHAVKVTNFGKARFEGGPTFAAGAMSSAMGTFVPERLLGEPTDHRTDIYSLCAVLFELITGERPFRATNAAAYLQEVMYQAVPPMEEMRPGVADGLQRIVEKGMAKRPEDRFGTMDLVVEALRAEQREGLQHQDPLPEEAAVAVLPFAAVGGDETLAAFCEGMTEEVAFQLQSISGLQVASTTSASRFRGRSEDLRKVGAQLGVNLILEGSARTAGNIVRVIIKLTDAGTGYQIWTERFDRDVANTLAVQDEVALAAKNVLAQRVAGDALPEPEPLPVSGMTSMFATTLATEAPYQPLLIDEIRQAACGLMSPKEVLDPAQRTARKNPDSADAQVALAYAAAVLGGSAGVAEEAFRKALRLEPGRIDAITGLATHVLAVERRFQEADALLAEADPDNLDIILASGWLRFFQADFEGAVGQCRRGFRINSAHPELYLLLTRSYAALGQYREATIAGGRGRVLAPEDPRIAAALSYSFARSGQAEESNRLADELGAMSKLRYASMLDVALPYAGQGLSDWVTCCLDRAREDKAAELLWWELSPEWAPFR